MPEEEFQNTTLDYKFSEKPKRDSGYNYYLPETKRSGCLSTFLAFFGAGNAVLLIFLFVNMENLSSFPEPLRSMSPNLLYIQMIQSLLIIIFVLGLWNWKKWGYWGMCLLYVLVGIGLGLTGKWLNVIIPVVELILLVNLVNPIYGYLE